MANLKPVTPDIIGRPQSVQRTDRPVRMAQPDFSGVAHSAGNLIASARKFTAGLEEIKRKEEELLFEERRNQYTAEANKLAQDTVFSLKGNAVLGAEEKLMDKLGKLSGKLSEGFSPEMARKWNIAIGRSNNAMALQAMRYRDQEVTRALDEQTKITQSNCRSAFAASGSQEYMNQGLEAYDKQYRLTHKNIITNQTLAEFDADVADGNGYVKLPDERRLKVGTDISMEQIGVIRSHMEAQAKEYETGRQALIDTFVADLVDTYLKKDETKKAEDILQEYIKSESNPIGVSDGAREIMWKAIDNKMEVKDMTDEADKLIRKASLPPDGDTMKAERFPLLSGKTEENIKAVIRTLNDGTETGERKARILEERYKQEKAQQLYEFSSTVQKEFINLKSLKPDLAKSTVEELRNNPDKVSKAVVAAWDRRGDEDEKTPAGIAKQVTLYAYLQEAITSGTMEFKQDGVGYTIRDEKGKLDLQKLRVFASMMGLSSNRQEELLKYAADSEKGAAITYQDVISAARKAGVKSPEGFLLLNPGLVSKFEKERNGTVYQNKGEEVYKKLIQFMLTVAQNDKTGWDAWNKRTDEARLELLRQVTPEGKVVIDD